jgi:hypothetical protein
MERRPRAQVIRRARKSSSFQGCVFSRAPKKFSAFFAQGKICAQALQKKGGAGKKICRNGIKKQARGEKASVKKTLYLRAFSPKKKKGAPEGALRSAEAEKELLLFLLSNFFLSDLFGLLSSFLCFFLSSHCFIPYFRG